MITIEELKRLDADNFGIELSGIELLHTGIPVQELVRFALSQHEEIESLKTILREAEHLASAEKGNLCARSAIGQLYRERDEAYERAAQTCEVESIGLEYSEHPAVDIPYNQAVKDCAMAIRALKSGGPK